MAYLIPVLLSLTILFAIFTTFYSYQNLSSEISFPKVHTLTEIQSSVSTNSLQNERNLLREMSQKDPPLVKRQTVRIDVTDTNDDSSNNNDDDDTNNDDDDDTNDDTDSGPDSERNLDSGSGGNGGGGRGSGNSGSGSNGDSNSNSDSDDSGSNSNSGSGGPGSNSGSGSNNSGSNSGPSENSGPGSGSNEDTDTDTDTLDHTDLPILDPEEEDDDDDDDSDTEPTIYVIDLSDYSDGEDPIVVIESNQTRTEIPNLVGDEQPIIVYGDDASIASWWTLENQELGFESWADLESYLVSEFGRNPPTGIDTTPGNLPIDLQIGIVGSETGEIESIIEFQGTEQNNLEVAPPDLALTTSVLDCVQVLTCQRILITGFGFRNVCKNQLICPNSETGAFLENEFPLDGGEFGFGEEFQTFQQILGF